MKKKCDTEEKLRHCANLKVDARTYMGTSYKCSVCGQVYFTYD